MLLGGAKCFGPGSNGTQGKAACQGTALERMHQLELHHPVCCSCKVQGLSWGGGGLARYFGLTGPFWTTALTDHAAS
jgi:hypothetical protein